MSTKPGAPQVLIVEDDVLVRFTLVQALGEAGIDAIEAGNSIEALETLPKADSIRVVVTDIDMPGSINGFGLVRALKEGRPYLRIAIISGLPVPKDITLSDDIIFFQKPFQLDQLTDVVKEFLAA